MASPVADVYTVASGVTVRVGIGATDIVALSLTAPTTATHPWAVGHVFAQGDVPAGAVLDGIQTTIKSTWPDGSARIALLAGESAMTADTPLAVTMKTGSAPAGAALTTADLKATGAVAEVGAGAFGTVSWATTDWDTPFEAWVSGPVMSSWVYRKPIGADAHLVAWLEVRLWASGAVEVLPWIENGYLKVAGPTNKSATYTFALGGTQRFSAAIDLPNRARTPLVSGALLSHWLAADPAVVPKHDAAYMQATKMVPTYRATTPPSAAAVTDQVGTYTPLQVGNHSPGMGGAGYHPSIGVLPQWDALYLTTAAASIWASLQRNAYGAGRYGIHFRDENTNRPIQFSVRSTLGLGEGTGVTGIGTNTLGDVTATGAGTVAPAYASTHHPSMGFMAYLVTGRKYHLETMQFVATVNFLKQGDTIRQNAAGIFLSAAGANTTRGVGWAIRSLGQAAAATPDNDPLFSEFIASLSSNVVWHHDTYVAQTNCPQGWIRPYSDYTPPTRFDQAIVAGASTIVLPSGYVFLTDDFYNGWELVAGGEVRTITDYVGATRTATLDSPFSFSSASTPAELRDDDVFFEATWMQDFVTAAFGYTKSLNTSLSAPNAVKLTEFFAWKAESVVGRFGTEASGDYLYRDAGGYVIAVSPSNNSDWETGAGPWFNNWGEAYALTNPSETKEEGDGSLRGGNFPEASGYWGNLQPALAYAVEHGISGASDAYLRMVGASNWAALEANFNATPEWGIAPPVEPVAVGLPAWRTSMAAWEWKELATANLIAVGPASVPGEGGPVFVGGSRAGRIDAWCGVGVIGTLVVTAGVGGHTDWAGNEGYKCDLLAEAPVWEMVNQPTANGDIQIDVTHYDDGRPTASHTYYALHGDSTRNKLFRFGIGAAYGSGNFQRSSVDAFDYTANDWDAAGTWPDVPEGVGIGIAACQHPTTGDVYVCGVSKLWRFNRAAGTFTELAAIPNGNQAVYYRASVIDTVRNRLVVLGNAYATPAGILIYDIAGNSWSTATLSGASAGTVAAANGDAAHYEPTLDKYLFFPGSATVLEVDPDTLVVSERSTTGGGSLPDSINGVFQKLVRVPALGGYAYQANGSSKLWFLASE